MRAPGRVPNDRGYWRNILFVLHNRATKNHPASTLPGIRIVRTPGFATSQPDKSLIRGA